MMEIDEERLWAEFVQPGEDMARANCSIWLSKYRIQRGWSKSLLRGAPQKDKKQKAQVAAREVLS